MEFDLDLAMSSSWAPSSFKALREVDPGESGLVGSMGERSRGGRRGEDCPGSLTWRRPSPGEGRGEGLGLRLGRGPFWGHGENIIV